MTAAFRVRLAAPLAGVVVAMALGLQGSLPAWPARAAPRHPVPQPIAHLVIGHSNVAPTWAPLWLAEEAGLFRQEGLDVEIHTVGPGATSIAALVRGDSQVLFTGGPGAVAGALDGADVAIFGGYLDRMPFHVVARPDLAHIPDLRGQAAAVNAFGGASDWVMRFVLAQAGLEPERDVDLLALGTDTQRLAGLRDGTIAATLLATPYHVLAEREGMRVLLNTATLPLTYSQSVLVATRSYLAANSSAIRALLRATAQALQLYKDDEALATRVLADRLGLADAELVSATWAFYRDAFSDDLVPRGLDVILEEALGQRPHRAGTRVADLVDLRYLPSPADAAP